MDTGMQKGQEFQFKSKESEDLTDKYITEHGREGENGGNRSLFRV